MATTLGETPKMEAAYGHHHTRAAPPNATSQSPWQSPVPYLFGGLAALLGLIALALLILACSFWKISGYLDDSSTQDDGGGGDGDDVEVGADGGVKSAFEEKILVIMAGEVKPTYLATPSTVSSSSASFGVGGRNICSCSVEDGRGSEVTMEVECGEVKLEGRSHMQGT
ncbi:hypothetical protein SAY86_026979 [Trapa natans]|uniref:Uncharacterized protein n=1 Tax=Trapa natans TaxID=22666 RepID=A0AAN7QIK7_TRANT|nr:hypothetical protein SAY86_026979 [Trapa natans]